VSTDDGATFTRANGGRPIATAAKRSTSSNYGAGQPAGAFFTACVFLARVWFVALSRRHFIVALALRRSGVHARRRQVLHGA
jgi:hypothetical protein